MVKTPMYVLAGELYMTWRGGKFKSINYSWVLTVHLF